MKLKFIVLALVPLSFVLAVGYLVHQRNYQRVFIELENGVSANIYDGSDEDKIDASQAKALYSFSKSFDKKIKKGTYLIATHNSIGYQDVSQVFTVGNKEVVLKLQLNLSKDKLSQAYDKESGAIMAALKARYPNTMKNYSLASPVLFKNGEWFGALLVPPNSSMDVLRVVMKKGSSGAWSVVTTPPGIVLSVLDYPQVPYEVLWGVNNLKWSWNP